MSVAEKQVRLSIHEIVGKLDELPTLPAVVYELNRVINDPMSSTAEVQKVMANDVALTATVLRLANSAYYAVPGGITSLQRAIAYIGYDTINQLTLAVSVFNALDVKEQSSFNLREFWKHSLGVAMASEELARVLNYKTPSDLFTCGLLHDMGKIATLIVAPAQFEETLHYAHEHKLSLNEAEETLQVAPHTHVGFELSVKWRLSSKVQNAIANHHQKDPAMRGGLTREANQIADIVFLSNLLIHALQFGSSGHGKVLGIPRDVLARLSLSQESLKTLITRLKEKIQSAESFLKLISEK